MITESRNKPALPAGNWFLGCGVDFRSPRSAKQPTRFLSRQPCSSGKRDSSCLLGDATRDGRRGNAANPHTRADWAVLSLSCETRCVVLGSSSLNIEFTWICGLYIEQCIRHWQVGSPLTRSPGGMEHFARISFNRMDPMRPRPHRAEPRPDDFRAQVIHETGHALGFEHDTRAQQSPQYWLRLTAVLQTRAGLHTVTPFDLMSIMNYSIQMGCPSANFPALSTFHYDIVGVQNAIRTPFSRAASSTVRRCLNIPMP